MKKIPISEFKATCVAVLEQVRKTKTPVLVTRFGKPIAEVVPPSVRPSGNRVLGSMTRSLTIHCDLVHVSAWLDAERS